MGAIDRPHNQIFCGLSRGDRWFVAGLLGVGLPLLTLYALRLSHWGTKPIELRHSAPQAIVYRLEMNRATWVEWAQLEGVGPSLARKIVDDREQRGPFQSVDDLKRVNGVGQKTLDRLRPWLTIAPVVPAKKSSSPTPGQP